MTTKWHYRADVIAACNCDWGCPCNFNARPTQGHCAGAYGLHITDGVCGNTKLDGVRFVWCGKWPGAIHEGNGTGKVWIDETATEPQRKAVEEILTGRHGGLPWMILGSTVDTWLDTAYVPFEWHFDGTRSRFKAGTEVQAALESMRNAVSGAEASATILLPNGMVCKELHPTATRTFSVFTRGFKVAAPGKYGFYAMTEHGN